jgi:hexosaminidase
VLKNKRPGAVYIDAETSLGVMHAFNTLRQLFYATSGGGSGSPVYGSAPVEIVDKPKFPHRGLNLDVSRQWYPKETIFKTIDAISWNKMNRLHLHVTDAQSWPLEIPALPELAQKGAYAPGLTYSPADLQDILDFAEARGIQVILETDMPGHTTSIAEAFPELIVGKNRQPNWGTYAAQPPSGSLKLNNPKVESFISTLIRDLLPRLRTHTNYFHSGGDEVNSNIYALDPGVGTNDTAVVRKGLQRFINHVQSEVKGQRMNPVVWEEMLVQWNLTLPKDAIVQTWQTDEAAQEATSKGHRVISGNYNFWYLDCGQGQWLDFGGKAFQQFYPFADYCSPRKNWRLIYSYSPTQFLTEKQAKLVLGGEVHIWSEQIDEHSIDVMLWPRASAAAEVLWSGRTDAQGKNRTFADASPRLGQMRERMVGWGVQASPIMQLWCHQNEGDCELNG